jgi:hypothetical protein
MAGNQGRASVHAFSAVAFSAHCAG